MPEMVSDAKYGRLRDAWESHAREWVEWARPMGHDHFYWQFNRERFLELVPDPGEVTLDIGCGEGRLARELMLRGHSVLGVDGSPTLARAAATTPNASFPVVVADAEQLPLRSRSIDLAIAFMVFHDVERLDLATKEAARVLIPGGRLCLAIVHPLASAAVSVGAGEDARFELQYPYLEVRRYEETIRLHGREMTFHSVHRPLADYFLALEDAGFVVEMAREPAPSPTHIAKRPEMARWRAIPLYFHLRAVLIRT